MMRGVVCGISVGVILCGGARAQGPDKPLQLASREPAFYAIVGTHIERAEAGSFASLRARLVLRLHNATIPEALTAIQEQTSLRFAYKPSILPDGAMVSLHSRDITVAAALTQILLDADVDVEIAPYGQATLVARDRVGDRPQPSDTIVVRGTITDSSTHNPVSGAVVRVAGGNQSALSGPDGTYAITHLSPGTYKLVVRRLGYGITTVEIVAPTAGVYTRNILLAVVPTLLNQVVTTVTGNQQLKAIGNTISIINADSLVPNTPVTSLSDVINARAPGVQVINNGGFTGTSPLLYIRGIGSLSQSVQPLLYIDGVRVSNSITTAPDYGGGTSGNFNSIVPEDIETIEIVKGPSAATLYGTDAANGVILITTKQGEVGTTRWNIYGEGGALTVSPDRTPLNYTGWGHAPGGAVTNACTLTAVASGSCVQDSVTKFSPLYVGSLTPFGDGNRAQVGAQVSGGGVRSIRYFISSDYASEVGPLKDPQRDQRILDSLVGPLASSGDVRHPNSVSRYDGRVNLTTQLGADADATISADYLSQTSHIPYTYAPSYAAGGAGYRDSYDGWYLGYRPATLFSLTPTDETQHFTGGATSHWRPTSWLTARATAGVDASNDRFLEVLPAAAAPVSQFPGGEVLDQHGTTTLYSVDLGATARVPLASPLVSSTSVGAQYHRTDIAVARATAYNLAVGATSVSGGISSGIQADSQGVVAGVYAEEQLALNDRLFVTGAVRVDGANDLGRDFQSAVYPKASVSWLVSRESFFPAPSWLSLWRLRAAYGESGTQPGLVLTTLQTKPVTVDGVEQAGTTLATLSNPNVQPERQKEFEAGTDLDLIDSRVHAEFTYYTKRTVNALYSSPIGASLGNVAPLEENIGEMWNWGYEALLSTEVVAARSFSWNISFNGSINHNQIIKIGPFFQPIYGSYGNTSIVAGYPIYSIFAQPYSYSDANDNGIIEPSEVTISPANKYVGPTIPPRQLTAATQIGFLNNRVRVGAQFDYRGGYVIPNEFLGAQCQNGTAFASVVRTASLADQAACVASSVTNRGFVEDGSFIRFRELSLTLVVPDRLVRDLRAHSMNISISARNIALWTRFKDGNPEAAGGTLSFAPAGIWATGGGVPATQYWLARINVGL